MDGSLFELDVSVERMERLIESWGPLAALASIGLMVLHSFVPFPAEVLGVANGMLFGPIRGTVITWVGAMLGAYLAFGLARLLGSPSCWPWSRSGTARCWMAGASGAVASPCW